LLSLAAPEQHPGADAAPEQHPGAAPGGGAARCSSPGGSAMSHEGGRQWSVAVIQRGQD